MVSNALGTETQSSILTVQQFHSLQFPTNKGKGKGSIHNTQTIMVIIITVSCCIVLALGSWAICLCCRKRQPPTLEHGRRPRGSFSTRGKNDSLPLTPDNIPLQKPLVVANQYTDHCPRKNSFTPSGEFIENRPPSSHLMTSADPLSSHLRQVIHPDSSSERDSGTGDSRKSRDNLDEVDCEKPLLNIPARVGGGESTASLTEFEDTNLDDYDHEDDEENGCGEAILSASNSLPCSENSSTTYSDSGKVSRTPALTSAEEVSFRTFHPNKSLRRDFLNHSDSVRPKVSLLKKRASAIDLNGEKYLVIESESPSQHRLDPQSYRGGNSMTSTPLLKGLAVNEKLLEYSLNSTDYSLHESQLVRKQSFVNSLPRRSRSSQQRRHKQKKQLETASKPEELYTNVPLKDDKMF